MTGIRNLVATTALVAAAATPALAFAATDAAAATPNTDATAHDDAVVQPSGTDTGFFHLPRAGETQPLAGEGLSAEAKSSDVIPAEDESGNVTVSVAISVEKGEFTLTKDALHITSVTEGKDAGVSDSAVLRDADSGQRTGDLTEPHTIKAGETVRAQFHVPGGDTELDDAANNAVVLHNDAGDPVASWGLH